MTTRPRLTTLLSSALLLLFLLLLLLGSRTDVWRRLSAAPTPRPLQAGRPSVPHGEVSAPSLSQRMLLSGQVQLPPLRAEYKNPCWLEDLPPSFSYNGSWYRDFDQHTCGRDNKHLQRYFAALERGLKLRPQRRVRCFPYFFVLGVAKSGTTDLFVALLQLPAIHRPGIKEPKFWNRVRFGAPYRTKNCHLKSVPAVTFAEYLDLFDGAAAGITRQASPSGWHRGIVGDFSPNTFHELSGWESVEGNQGGPAPLYTTAHHILSIRPQTKFILIFREPVDRAYSLYRFRYNDQPDVNVSAADFHIRVSRAAREIQDCFRLSGIRSCLYPKEAVFTARSLLLPGLYSAYLEDWLRVFPLSAFLVLRFEDYMDNRSREVDKVVDFLELEPMTEETRRRINAYHPKQESAKKEEMLAPTRSLLQQFYSPFNRRLAELISNVKFTWQYG